MTSCVDVVAVRISCARRTALEMSVVYSLAHGSVPATSSWNFRNRVSLRATRDQTFHPRRDQPRAGASDRPRRADDDRRGASRVDSHLARRRERGSATPAAIVSELPVVTGIGERSLMVTPASPTTAVKAPKPATCAPSSAPISMARTTRR